MTSARNGTERAVLYQSSTSVSEASRKAITSIYGTFARELGTQLSVYLRSAVSVKYAGLEECSFTQFLGARKPGACASSIKGSSQAPVFESNLLLDVEPSLLFAFVEVMLGGKPAARPMPDRPPTEIEKQLVALVLTSTTAQLERAWCTMGSVSMQFGRIERDPQVARMFSPADAVLAARFDVAVGEQTGSLTILIPTQAAEAVIEDKPDTDGETEIPEATRISQTVLESSIRFDVWLDGVSLQLRDLVQLREGHVIKFDYPTGRNLQSTLNGVAGFSGQVVSTGHKRAFLIQSEAG